ncbi:MAG: hypothetical protein WBX27_15680, partial [Specibacter sp.]
AFTIEINDLAALKRFTEKSDPQYAQNGLGQGFPDEHDHVTKAVMELAAEAFYNHKSETGLQIRSMMIID